MTEGQKAWPGSNGQGAEKGCLLRTCYFGICIFFLKLLDLMVKWYNDVLCQLLEFFYWRMKWKGWEQAAENMLNKMTPFSESMCRCWLQRVYGGRLCRVRISWRCTGHEAVSSVCRVTAGEAAILRNTCESEFKVEGSYFWKATFPKLYFVWFSWNVQKVD